ncbi:putative baseplate assembly protein [Rhizobium terrae]|uniref:putative baseplate assembly protein n=1 Tax=Rhizobium terrae TaxID=2171756 RepID=UPI000E3E9614|nr:putative baseplate assembly protein [Rhizobium terrae]
MIIRQHCGSEARRQKVLASNKQIGGLLINGIDFLEVLDDDTPVPELRQRLIDVSFLRPDGLTENGQLALTPGNFVIEGGVRIRGIRVTAVEPGPDVLTVRLTLDRYGDFSRYRLIFTDGQTDEPPANFDHALATVEFSFKADCPTDFDCLPASPADSRPEIGPSISYLAKDYESFRQLMLDRMAETIPAWTERSPADLGVTLVEALAYAADMASYYQDGVATEAYLSRARLRASARRHARLLGYRVNEGCNARAFVAIDAAQDAEEAAPPLLPAGTVLLTRPPAEAGFGALAAALPPVPGKIAALVRAGCRIFETMEDVSRLRVARNALHFHTWSGDICCLPVGTTGAHLVGTLAATKLDKGDVLILEERIPLGGTAADPPDPDHRQAVRLIETPREYVDRLDDTSVLEVRWGQEDALAFALSLTDDGAEPAAVARANVVLADHGRTLDYAYANRVEADVAAASLHADLRGRSALSPPSAPVAAPWRPIVADAPITRAVPYVPSLGRSRSARATLSQMPEEALAAITLVGGGETWTAQADLLLSDRFASEFVVETANAGGASLRFGDGRFGRAPPEGAALQARLRVGNGPDGNVGAGAIGHVVMADTDLIASLTNPLPAIGGTGPETLTAIKLSAPRAFKRQKRAVTTEDYMTVVGAYPDVQRAYAERRWTGSWHTMFIAVDRKGGREVDEDFEAALRGYLETFRLAGHDVEIEPPVYVPLDVALVVCVASGHYAEHVEAALLDRFSVGHTLQNVPGFFHPDRFTFGQPVLLSPIIAAAMGVEGVRWVGIEIDGFPQTGRFRRLDEQSIDYAEEGVLPIGRREVARLDNDPNAPERGRLRFYMEGGR